MDNIENSEGSIVMTSNINYSSWTIENPGIQLFGYDDTEDQYHYEFHSVQYICQKCGESFDSPDLHRQHELSTHLNIKVEDEHKFASGLNDDLDQTIEDSNDLQQPIYGSKVDNVSKLNVSVKTSKPIKYFHCNICKYKTTVRTKFVKHQRCHQNPELFICEDCGQCFKLKITLEKHLNQFHISRIRCRICQEKSVGKNDFQVHMKSHKVGKFYCCNLCQYKSLQLSYFTRHISLHLKSECYFCDYCGRSTESKKSIENHLILYHSSEFKWQTYQKQTVNQNASRLHMKIHREKKYYYCDECEFKTTFHSWLMNHKNQHIEPESYNCYNCNKPFKSNTTLIRHLSLCRT